ncbi:MAG: LamB/YcsF family protein [Actinobacteria bacterium]|nr:LamB/YcsF family protein [Actinomycetota bacterium]
MSRLGAVDLNCDVGEGFGHWPGGPDEELMRTSTSVNVACGFHAGDPSIMRRTCELAEIRGCAIGAQVGYPDLVGFGRRFIDMRAGELTDAVLYQLGALAAFARACGSRVRYVKPHGALYNAIVDHAAQAKAVVAAVQQYDAALPLLGLPGSVARQECDTAGVRYVPEGFADRAYTPEGRLLARNLAGALITDPTTAAEQALALAKSGVESICVHSDTPGATKILDAVARALTAGGYDLTPFVK